MKLKLAFLTLFFFAACSPYGSGSLDNQNPLININTIRANLQLLSSDELEGREAGTRGEKLAAMYLASQLRQYGVKPFAYSNSRDGVDSLNYFMEFEATKISILPASYIMIYDSLSKKETPMTYGQYFVNFHDQLVNCNIQAPVVFAGFGITAPEYNYDDYAELNVKGKIVIALDGEPQTDDENYFDGEIQSTYSSAQFYKRHRAKELGAKAFIVLAYDGLRSKWDDYIDYFRTSKMVFNGEYFNADDPERLPFFYANNKFFENLLTGSEHSYDSIRSLVSEKKDPPRFDIKYVNFKLRMDTKATSTKAMNVVGIIEGRDDKLKNEFVAIGAHFDHLGTNDSGVVFNGADDDGSGTVAVLEVARAFSRSHDNKRSILIVFHGAEEKGLLGSEYLTSESTAKPFQLSQIVSQINIDMVGRESADSIYVIGSGRLSSELKTLNENINRKLKLFTFDYTFDADDDPNRYYYRSDHYNYARFGIPVVFFFDGMTTDYHKSTDDIEKINFPKIEKTATLVYNLAQKIANQKKRLKVDGK
ncbi:M20/M25/M40 family metallo-hydrolase [bacterium]|nr:MAG: M20/M25/M40 family metallo-hydrolase [bacterium]